MTRATASRSIPKAPPRHEVWDFVEQRLVIRLPTSKGIASDDVGVEIDLTTYQTMWPQRVYGEGAAEQPDASLLVAPSQEDDTAARRRLQIELPIPRKRLTGRGALDARRGANPTRADVAVRPVDQSHERVVMEPRPHLALPAPIQILECGLERRLIDGCEDRDDAQAQAHTHHPTNGITVLVGSLKPRIVVKLGIGRKAHRLPMLKQDRHDGPGRHRAGRPGADQAAVQRDRVQHFDVRATLNDQARDDIKTIELGPAGGGLRQIPPPRWRGAANAAAAIERTPARKNPIDRADRGTIDHMLSEEGAVNRRGAVPANRSSSGARLARSAPRPQAHGWSDRSASPPAGGRSSRRGPAGQVPPGRPSAERCTNWFDTAAPRHASRHRLEPWRPFPNAVALDELFIHCVTLKRHQHTEALRAPAYGSCRTCGSQKRFHKVLGKRSSSFPQLPQALPDLEAVALK